MAAPPSAAPLRPAHRVLVAHALAATGLSLPWPTLLSGVWQGTRSDLWLGAAGASRMLPYVLLSVAAGVLADRLPRVALIRATTLLRVPLLAGCAWAGSAGDLGIAVALAVLSVAVATPAYPAAVAALPALGGTSRTTALLVTAEVSGFVVGPAVGGLLVGAGAGAWAPVAGALLTVLAVGALLGVRAVAVPAGAIEESGTRWRRVLSTPGVLTALALVAAVNFTESFASVSLVGLSDRVWGAGPQGYGVAAAALGFGSLAAPLLTLVVTRRGSLLLGAGGLAGTGLAPAANWALLPLGTVGAAGTVTECATTEVLQRAVPDDVRGSALGLADAVMVAAAFAGSLIAPTVTGRVGGPLAFGALALILAGAAAAVWRVRQPRGRLATVSGEGT